LTAKGKVTGNENVKIVFFTHIFVKNRSIYVKSRLDWAVFYVPSNTV